MMTIIIFASFTLISPTLSAQHGSEGDEMPNFAASLIVDNHYITIEQTSQTTLLVDENIWFNNTGDEDFSGKIYTWSQPGNILKEIRAFSVIYNEKTYNLKVHPVSNFLYVNTTGNVSLKPGEILQMAFSYTLEYPIAEKNLFGKTFLYDNENILITFEPFEDTQVKGENDLELIYLASSNKYVTQHSVTLSKIQGEGISFSFSKDLNAGDDDTDPGPVKVSSENSTKMFIYILIIIAIGFVIIMFIYKKGNKNQTIQEEAGTHSVGTKTSTRQKRAASKWAVQESEHDPEPADEKVETVSSVEDRSELTGEIKKILKTTERLKKDYKSGLISKEIFDELRGEYKLKLKKIKKRIAEFDEESTQNASKAESKEMRELLLKKERMLKAISKLEDDRETGVLDEELYEEMVGVYKKQTIEILKEIDRIKE